MSCQFFDKNKKLMQFIQVCLIFRHIFVVISTACLDDIFVNGL